jgi:glycosyltransferase involved in cell wall biosynthesis
MKTAAIDARLAAGHAGRNPEDAAFIGGYPSSSRPLVTILTPTCNHERYIAACLDSVLAQDFQSWEMVVIDDASRDGTAEIVSGYARKDGRLRLLRHEANWGMEKLAATCNEGLSIGSGEWVAILEGDDAWPPWKLRRQLEQIDPDAEVVLGFGRALLLSASGRRLGEVQAGLPRDFRQYFANFRGPALAPLLLRPCFIHPVTVMVRRAALAKIGGFRQPPGLGLVDHPTFLELARQGPFFGSSEILGHYRRHRDSQSLNRIVELTAAERRLAFGFLNPGDAPRPPELLRRMNRSWALEGARALLTEGRLLLLRGRRREARLSFRRCLLAEKFLLWLHFPLLAVKLASLGALLLSFFPVRLERIAGWLHVRSASLLERSDETDS